MNLDRMYIRFFFLSKYEETKVLTNRKGEEHWPHLLIVPGLGLVPCWGLFAIFFSHSAKASYSLPLLSPSFDPIPFLCSLPLSIPFPSSALSLFRSHSLPLLSPSFDPIPFLCSLPLSIPFPSSALSLFRSHSLPTFEWLFRKLYNSWSWSRHFKIAHASNWPSHLEMRHRATLVEVTVLLQNFVNFFLSGNFSCFLCLLPPDSFTTPTLVVSITSRSWTSPTAIQEKGTLFLSLR